MAEPTILDDFPEAIFYNGPKHAWRRTLEVIKWRGKCTGSTKSGLKCNQPAIYVADGKRFCRQHFPKGRP